MLGPAALAGGSSKSVPCRAAGMPVGPSVTGLASASNPLNTAFFVTASPLTALAAALNLCRATRDTPSGAVSNSSSSSSSMSGSMPQSGPQSVSRRPTGPLSLEDSLPELPASARRSTGSLPTEDSAAVEDGLPNAALNCAGGLMSPFSPPDDPRRLFRLLFPTTTATTMQTTSRPPPAMKKVRLSSRSSEEPS